MKKSELAAVLRAALPRYIASTQRAHPSSYMCCEVAVLARKGIIASRTGWEAEQAIERKIEGAGTLSIYLRIHDLPREPDDKIAFYQTWIAELEAAGDEEI